MQATADRPKDAAAIALESIRLADIATANVIALCHFLHGQVIDGRPRGEYVPAGFHRKIARIVEAVDRGDIRRAIISMPPQHGKSTHTTKTAPIFHIGRAEAQGRRLRVGIAAYAVSLAHDMAVEMRDAIEAGKVAEVFPALKVRRDSRAATNWYTEGGSSVRAVGVGGGFTGKPFDIIYIDDPYKNMDEAMSEAHRARVSRWYKTVVRPRLQDTGRLVLIQTRWHSQDLAGELLAGAAEGGKDAFEEYSLPAIIDEGLPTERALWPERYGLDYLHRTREICGVRFWSTVYQQIPIDRNPGETLPEPARWSGPEPTPAKVFGLVDPAYDGADKTVWVYGGELPDGRLYVSHGETRRKNAVLAAPSIVATAIDAGAALTYVESNKDEGYTAAALRTAGGEDMRVKEYKESRNKLARINANVRQQWHRIVFGPRVSPEFLRRLAEWTEDDKHDDEPDALAGLVARLTRAEKIAYTDL